jgi:cytoskeleton protein RodZ
LRTKDLISLSPEHVEVEGADGTTQIHPLDEPEDQAVAEGQAEGSTVLALPQAETSTEAPAEAEPAVPVVAPAAPAAPAPVAPTHNTAPAAPAPVAPAHSTAPVVAPAAPTAPVVSTPPATASVTPTIPAPAAAAPVAPVAGQGQVQLQFTADCWTQVTDGTGKVLLSGLKRKGETVSLSGKPPFAVRLGFARGAQVSYNGQVVDVAPFTSGETARLKLGQ